MIYLILLIAFIIALLIATPIVRLAAKAMGMYEIKNRHTCLATASAIIAAFLIQRSIAVIYEPVESSGIALILLVLIIFVPFWIFHSILKHFQSSINKHQSSRLFLLAALIGAGIMAAVIFGSTLFLPNTLA